MSFIFKITTTTSPQTFVIPCVAVGTFNATVDYGDGTGSQTVTAYNDANLTHSFATAGQHTITIDGTFPNVRFYDNAASREALDEVVDLGDVGWVTFYRAFRGCTNLTDFNVGTADTSNVTSTYTMFYNCSNLTTLNVSSFNTSSVSNMGYMFESCSSLTSLDLSNFDTSNVTNMLSMFINCTSLTALDVTSFDTSSVTTISRMFYNCSSLTILDVSNFNTSNVTNMADTFLNCTSLTSLDLSGFDTSSVTEMSYMFFGCASLTSLGLSSFDTSSVNDMSVMFGNCLNLTGLGLSSFDTSSVTNIQSMFANCLGLTSLNIKHFDVSNVTNGTNFLLNANNALTTTAYDELLEAWAAQDVQPNVPWHFGDAQYTVEAIANWYSPRSNSSLSIINNKLVSIAGSTNTFGVAQQVDNLIVGNRYKIVAALSLSQINSSIAFRVATASDLNGQVLDLISTGTANIDNTFIATATTMYVGAIVGSPQPIVGDTITIDAGISLTEITNYSEANAASEIEYSQENVFGSEAVVNGDFATDSDWGKGTGWSISGGSASYNGASGTRSITQHIVGLVAGSTYEVTLTVLSQGSGSNTLYLGNTIFNQSNLTVGTHSFIGKTTNTAALSIFGRDGNVFTIDNVSVKEITNAVEYKNIPQSARELYTLEDAVWVNNNELIVNGDFSSSGGWTQGSSWNIGGGNATCTGAYSLLTTAVGDTFNSSYKVKYTIESWSGGSIKMSVGGYDQTTSQTNNGTYTEIYNVSNPSSNTTFYVIPTSAVLSVDNISVKRAIEVADFVEPVTSGMTRTAAWTVAGTAYTTLGEALSGSVRVDATISNTDSGILMESGGLTLGLVLYVHSGVLYFQCGNGRAFGTAADRAEVSYILPVGEFDYIIEWSADLTNAVLYVNGLRVGSQTFIDSRICGSDNGTIGQISNAAASNRGGWTANAGGVYTNTITKCDVFLSQVTSDV